MVAKNMSTDARGAIERGRRKNARRRAVHLELDPQAERDPVDDREVRIDRRQIIQRVAYLPLGIVPPDKLELLPSSRHLVL